MDPILFTDHLEPLRHPVDPERARLAAIDLRGAVLVVAAIGACCLALALTTVGGYPFEAQPITDAVVASARN